MRELRQALGLYFNPQPTPRRARKPQRDHHLTDTELMDLLEQHREVIHTSPEASERREARKVYTLLVGEARRRGIEI